MQVNQWLSLLPAFIIVCLHKVTRMQISAEYDGKKHRKTNAGFTKARKLKAILTESFAFIL